MPCNRRADQRASGAKYLFTQTAGDLRIDGARVREAILFIGKEVIISGIKVQMKQDASINAVDLQFGGPVPTEQLFEVKEENMEQYEQNFDEVTEILCPWSL